MTLTNTDNTLLTANALNITSSTSTIQNAVGVGDLEDNFSFKLSNRSSVSLNLSGLSANADLQLIRDANANGLVDAGEAIASSTLTGTSAEFVGSNLDAGNYFVRVYSNGATTNTNYSLSFSAALETAGNDLSTARVISPGVNSTNLSEWVGRTDAGDFYRFTLSNRNTFNVNLNGLAANADIELIRDTNNNLIVDSGEVISSSKASGTTAESITTTLDAGNYFIRVLSVSSANTNYNMGFSAKLDVGNTIPTAQTINVNQNTTTLSDWVGSTDNEDFYRFSVGFRSDLKLNLDGLSGNADVELIQDRNNNGKIDTYEVINFSRNTGTTAESINTSLNAGNYFIRVVRGSGANTTNYNMSVSAVIPDLAGNTLTDARQITLGASNTTFRDFVGSVDSADMYRFVLNNSSFFNLKLDGLSANADVQLLDGAGNAVQLSNNAGITQEVISRTLNAGTYFLRVFPNSGVNTNYNLTVAAASLTTTSSTTSTTSMMPLAPSLTTSLSSDSDWFTQNLRDEGVRAFARDLASDGSLSRADMMSLFSSAVADGNTVDGTELSDLRAIINNANPFQIQEHVRVLGSKVVNGDTANINSKIGNLAAGSTMSVMDSLVNKWFLGTDRPITLNSGHTYQYAQGSLFQNGVNINDIKQGAVGNCYFLAVLGAIANETPNQIESMFIDNGDDTFTVRFSRNGKADYVTVDRMLAANSSGNLVYSGAGRSVHDTTNELWVALAEKAYVQLNESGIGRDISANSFAAIEGGWMSDAVRDITGGRSMGGYISTSGGSMTEQQLIDITNSNNLLTVGFNIGDSRVITGHAYTITSYNSTTKKFFVHNPWGTKHAELTWEEMKQLDTDFSWSV